MKKKCQKQSKQKHIILVNVDNYENTNTAFNKLFLKKSKKITSGAFSYTSDNNKAWGN